jgi:nicotinate-nucleotide--dimethylbenzimidazole phosphoribosyltransferase
MTEYARPVPLIGDATAASQRAESPAAWAFPADARSALHEIVGARRDVRRFRPDPIPDDVLTRVLEAGHAAPSVGHSQPWRFVVIRSDETRDRAAVLTDRERLRQAAVLDPESARHLLDLQLEGIREAPLGLVVCCDRRTEAAGTLGRATFTDSDVWSCVAAVQNIWLAARAEGLGLGWVTLFRPEDLAGLLGLPDGVETLGWLCLGWPDERPPAPGLERAGWSRRAPLSDVVLHERWSESAPPPRSRLRAPGQTAVVTARDESDRLLTPPGSLGVLDRAVDRANALGHRDFAGGTALLAAADHPAADLGVSAFAPTVTADVVRAAVRGESLGAVAATAAGLTSLVVDAGLATEVAGTVAHRPRDPRGDLLHGAAMSMRDVEALLAAGADLGAGADRVLALGEVGVGNTTVAAAVAAALLRVDPALVVGRGAGADSAMVARKVEVVAGALARVDPKTPEEVLAELGGPELAVLAGAVLGAARAGHLVVLDGLVVCAAAAIAVAIEPAAQAHLVAGHRSREQGHAIVLEHLGLEPLLDLRIRAGEGVGASLAVGLLKDAMRLRADTARVSY